MSGLLYRHDIPVNKKIAVSIPTLREIFDYGEDEYYSLVSSFTSMPIDIMVQLDDIGIDFEKINEFELFLILFQGIREKDTRLILGDLDLSKFSPAINNENSQIVLLDKENDIVIDSLIYGQISTILRNMHHIQKNTKTPGNEEAKRYLIERARKKMKRARHKEVHSQLEELIVALVNTEHFKYDYNSVLDLSIYQFNESVYQIIKKVDYDNRMIGIYSGTVDVKQLSQDDLNWLTHK